MTLRLAVLVSGGGTTLQNLLDKIAAGDLDAQVALVVASNSSAFGLERARRANVPTHVATTKGRQLEEYSKEIFDRCRSFHVDLVVLGGFLRLLKIPDDFCGRTMNIHPALIPSFCGSGMYGKHVHQAVLDHGAKLSGVTVHFADNQYDHGPIILQRSVPVAEDDTAQSLAQRVFAAECEAYPEAIRLFAQGRLHIEGRRVRIDPPANPVESGQE